jgi:16S rRNA (uracil1498-N3)-methyltransferase
MPDTPSAFLVLDDALMRLHVGSPYTLDGDEGRHAAKVARVREGETILLTDADGRQAPARVSGARKESLDLELVADPSAPVVRTPRLALVQALATGGRDEQAVESATELGVDRITPWGADRSVAVWKGEKRAKGRARWVNTVRAAVKQCRRPGIPVVDEVLTSQGLVDDVRSRVEAGGLVLVLHEQESRPLMALAEKIGGSPSDGEGADGVTPEITVIVGPEGGTTPGELDILHEAGARSVLLGPEVLRCSTAGPAALAVISTLVGRWG